MKLRLVIVTFGSLIIAACSSSGAPATTQAQRVDHFVTIVRADAPRSLRAASRTKLTSAGRGVCEVFKAGSGYGAADGILRGSGGATAFQSWLFIGAAVTVFCPRFHGQVPPHSPPGP